MLETLRQHLATGLQHFMERMGLAWGGGLGPVEKRGT